MSGFGNMDDLKSIEHSTLKVPYETLNKQYRNVQKAIDRDCSSLSQSILSVDKFYRSLTTANDASPNNSVMLANKADLLNTFRGVVDKLNAIKRRSIDLRNDEKELLALIKARIDHLKESQSQNLVVSRNFKRLRIDRMLIDYFLRVGFYETAQMLAEKSKIQVRLDEFFVMIRFNTF
jgi:macrophage erythroblast attacher